MLNEIEKEIQALHSQALASEQDNRKKFLEQGVALAIKQYGPEVRAWILRRLGEYSTGSDVFQETCFSLWRAFPSFRWDSSLRTWFYKIAFFTFCSYMRKHSKTKEGKLREVRLETSKLDALVEDITTMGGRYHKKQILSDALEKLPEEDQWLVVFRQVAGEGANWKELAYAWNGYKPFSSTTLDKEAARLRQRFHRSMDVMKSVMKQSN